MGLSAWIALTVKDEEEFLLLHGKTLNGAPEMPFGMRSPLVMDEQVKLLLSWLAMVVEVAAAMFPWENPLKIYK